MIKKADKPKEDDFEWKRFVHKRKRLVRRRKNKKPVIKESPPSNDGFDYVRTVVRRKRLVRRKKKRPQPQSLASNEDYL